MTARTTLFLIILLSLTTAAFGQSTEFTYQGRLLDSNIPQTGTFDLEFRLFDASVGGTELGVDLVPNVAVSSGIFTVHLDFAGQFDGSPRYLQIAVKPSGSPDPLLVLTPRQPISSAPYSIRSLNSAVADISIDSQNLGGQPATHYVDTDDKRLTDAREPLPGSDSYIQNGIATSQVANFNINGRGEANVFGASMQYDLGSTRILSSPGTLNTFVGINTGNDLTTGERNTFVGRNTGIHTTTGSTNTFVGSGAGFENTTGSQNSFFGYNAGLRVTTATMNSIFGVSAGASNLTGLGNSMFGFEAGSLTTGDSNSFFGTSTGRSNTSGASNSFFGRAAGFANTIGVYNAFHGRLSGQQNTTGSYNTFLGGFAGNLNLTGSNNTALGFGANFATDNLSHATAIGAGTIVATSNTIQLGRSNGDDDVLIPGDLHITGNITGGGSLTFIQNRSTGIQSGNFHVSGTGQAGEFNARDNYDLASETILLRVGSDIWLQNLLAPGGLDFRSNAGISALYISPNSLVRVRTTTGGISPLCLNADFLATCSSSIRYKENVAGFSRGREIINRLRPVAFDWKSNGLHDLGLVAEEVAEVEPLLVTYNDKGEIEGVKYDRVGVVLINVVKEQQRQIEELKAIVCEIRPDAAVCQ